MDRAPGDLVKLGAALSASASLLFALLIPEQIVQSEADRAFFVAVAVAQMALALVLLFARWWSGPRSRREWRLGRATCLAGIGLAAVAMVVFGVTQVTGSAHHAAPGSDTFDVVGLLPRLVDVALIAVLARLYAVTPLPASPGASGA